MINFASLVLAPAMGTFGSPITVTPLKSQPTGAAYSARGIWEIVNVRIVTEDGGQLATRTIKLGIRVAEFAVWPAKGDKVTTLAQYLPMGFDAGLAPTANVDFVIDTIDPDGQGGASVILKRVIS